MSMNTDRKRLDGRLSLSSKVRLRLGILFTGMFGLVVFGALMNSNIAPGRVGGGQAYADGFHSILNIITIPGFLLSGAIVVFAANELYKCYRDINNPRRYGVEARRARRSALNSHSMR